MGSRLDGFLEQVRRAVAVRGQEAEGLADEVRDHLMSATDELRQRGLDSDEAEKVALARFGAPDTILEGYPWEANTMTLWIRRVLTLLASLTSLAATVVVIHSIAFDDGSAAAQAIKITQGGIIIAAGLITLLYWSRGPVQSTAVLAGVAVWLVVSGTAAAVWTLRLAQTTGDLEAWAVLANLMVAAQGGLLGWLAMTRAAQA